MSKKMAGGKIAGSHSTVIDAAYDLAKSMQKIPEIDKISLGIIRVCRPGRGGKKLKIKETSSGLELMIRGNTYAQTLYVYLAKDSSKERVSANIEKLFEAQ